MDVIKNVISGKWNSEEYNMSKIRIRFLNLILFVGLLLCITGCQSEKQDSSVVESVPQKEETIEVESEEVEPVETESVESDTEEVVSSSQPEDAETSTESDASEELKDIVKNDFFSVSLDSMTEEDENVVMTFVFTNVSDISYYKGDEEFHPGDSWEKIIRFTRDKWENYDNVYIHYKLCDSSIYDPNAQVLFAGGAHFEMDEELNVFNLEIFVDVPIQTE